RGRPPRPAAAISSETCLFGLTLHRSAGSPPVDWAVIDGHVSGSRREMKMHRPWLKPVSLWLLALAANLTATAQAEDYPTRPVKIISDSAPGSAVDVTLRMVADRLGQIWGQQVLPVNQPGAGGSLAVRLAATSPADGYTLFIPAVSTFVAVPGAAPNMPIEVPRDFAPVGFLRRPPMFINAAPSLGVKTLPELIALAKRRPSELIYGTNGRGRLTHLTGELLQSRANIKLLMIPYSGGTAQILNDVMGGRVPLVIEAFS